MRNLGTVTFMIKREFENQMEITEPKFKKNKKWVTSGLDKLLNRRKSELKHHS